MLYDYVEAVTKRVIAQKLERKIDPPACTLQDIMHEAREDITECMRQLARDDKFRASININRTPMLLPKPIEK